MLENIKQRAKELGESITEFLAGNVPQVPQVSLIDREFLAELKANLEGKLGEVEKRSQELRNGIDELEDQLDQTESLENDIGNLLSDIDSILDE